jgi:hypothetical protein
VKEEILYTLNIYRKLYATLDVYSQGTDSSVLQKKFYYYSGNGQVKGDSLNFEFYAAKRFKLSDSIPTFENPVIVKYSITLDECDNSICLQ